MWSFALWLHLSGLIVALSQHLLCVLIFSLQGCRHRIMEFLSQKIHIIFAVIFAAVLCQVSLVGYYNCPSKASCLILMFIHNN